MAMLLIACGDADDRTTAGGPGLGRETSSAANLEPAQALPNSPIRPDIAASASNQQNLFLASVEGVAVFNVDSGQWRKSALPWEPQRVNGLVISIAGNQALGVAKVCNEPCGRSSQQQPIQLRTFSVAADATFRSLRLDGPTQINKSAFLSQVQSSREDPATEILVGGGEESLLLNMSPEGTEVQRLDGAFHSMCRTADGLVAMRLTDRQAPGAIEAEVAGAAELPEVDLGALQVLSGREPTSLSPVLDLSEGFRALLANRMQFAVTCTESAMAVVGKQQAFESGTGDDWRNVSANLQSEPLGTGSISHFTTSQGTVFATTPYVRLRRDPGRGWTEAESDKRVYEFGDTIVTYSIPTGASPPPDPNPYDPDGPGGG